MRKGDAQIGLQAPVYTDTAANIEALTGVAEGAVAYASDTDEFGTYDGAAWTWGSGGGVLASFETYLASRFDITPDNNWVKVPFDTEKFDTGSYYDSATNYRWTPPAGTVIIHVNAIFYESNTNGQNVEIRKNNTSIAIASHRSAITYDDSRALSVVDIANGTDYYEVFAWRWNGTTDLLEGSNRTLFGGVCF